MIFHDLFPDYQPRCKFFFSDFEKALLRELYEKDKPHLKCKIGASPLKVRERAWRGLAFKYNSTAGVRCRSVKQLKKFIENMNQKDKRLRRALDGTTASAIPPSLPEVADDGDEDSVLGLPVGGEEHNGVAFHASFPEAQLPRIEDVRSLCGSAAFQHSSHPMPGNRALLSELETKARAIEADTLRKTEVHVKKLELLELERQQRVEKHNLQVRHLEMELRVVKLRMAMLEGGLAASTGGLF
ncbi:hypothetical protein HPB47_010952 [Ixodes persulcatus]|uniref:Uncharacterized protein n=1 Tax=Ixodes persulcatus TaxID=34615 RepID=A0AC60NXQ4_IXOPE|nr:hypothetical protein HPB47_010952 [Ixodes persulcatus]